MKIEKVKIGMTVYNKNRSKNMIVKSVKRSPSWVGGGYVGFGGRERTSIACIVRAKNHGNVKNR